LPAPLSPALRLVPAVLSVELKPFPQIMGPRLSLNFTKTPVPMLEREVLLPLIALE
jgi:hypothetical protein